MSEIILSTARGTRALSPMMRAELFGSPTIEQMDVHFKTIPAIEVCREFHIPYYVVKAREVLDPIRWKLVETKVAKMAEEIKHDFMKALVGRGTSEAARYPIIPAFMADEIYRMLGKIYGAPYRVLKLSQRRGKVGKKNMRRLKKFLKKKGAI